MNLLDLLAELEPGTEDTHVLMPNMAYACGGTMLDTAGRFQVGITNWSAITCPGCAALDPGELRAEMKAQQGRQADVA